MTGEPLLRHRRLLLLLFAYVSAAAAEERRDIVFDCPCSAEFVAGVDGELGSLTLSGGVRSYRAVKSGAVWLFANSSKGPDWVWTEALSAGERRRGEWTFEFGEPETGAAIEVRLHEETGRDAKGVPQAHLHEALALWPAPSDEKSDPLPFVDILTDGDGDRVGDVNERLAGTSPDDPESTPGETVVDVLALYTAEYAEAETGYPYTRLLHAITVSSALFEDSATGLSLRLVGMSEVELDDDGWAQRESRQELMESHGADLSVQFSPTGPCAAGGCAGVGFRRTSRWSDGRPWDGTASVWVTAHELGHVMGLAHSARQGEAWGAWRWSRGHYVTPRGETPRWGTVMAYGARLLGGVFSDPSADCGSGPCGVPAHELDGADSVTTLDRMRFQVGAHREPAADSDGDGIVDAADAAPDDPGDWFDVDGDGTADNADPDDDNDGTPDVDDAFPLDGSEWADADGDGVGDNADTDVRDLSPFRDPGLRAAVEDALGKASGGAISVEELAGLSELRAPHRDIHDLTGLEHATGLVRLYLRGNRIEDLDSLSGLADLEGLDLAGNAVADLQPLASLTRLSFLSLNGNPVEDVSPLSELPSLGCVYLSHTDVALADVLALPRFSRFRCLGIGGLGVGDLSALSGLGLVNLDLADNAIDDLEPLVGLDGLKWLILDRNRIADLSPLSALTGLETLALRENTVSDIAALQGLTNLKNLSLDANRIADLSSLSAMIDLESLGLGGNDVTDIDPLAAMVRMKRLYLWDNQIFDVSALSALTGLETLVLRDNAVSDLGPLADLKSLRSLDLLANRIADVTPLSGLTGLGWLNLDYNGISDIGPLVGLTQLRSLYLSGSRIEDMSALAGMTELTSLNLSDNTIADIGPLERLVNLNWLLLNGNRISNLSPLGAMTGLESLGLASNAIVDIAPLVRRSVFGGEESTGAFVNLDGNPLDESSTEEHIPTLQSWGVRVRFTRSASSVAALAIVDPTLRAVLADALAVNDVHVDDPARKWPIGSLGQLRLQGRGVASLAGLEAAGGLEVLYAASNRIVDLSPLAALSRLRNVDLRNNRVSDLSPLVANGNLGEDDWVALDGNPLSEESLNTHVPALLERGVRVSAGSVALSLVANEAPTRFDVSGYFEALLGEDVALTATSGDLSLTTAEVSDGALVVTPGARAGVVTVTVEATNNAGEIATLDFLVRVRGPWLIPLVPSASGSRQGFVRIANLDGRAGEVRIRPVDDTGRAGGELTLSIGAGETVHFNSDDLETGNPDKGLTGSSGSGTGDWRLELGSDLDLDVLSYVRTPDGFLTAMHDVAVRTGSGHRVPIFNPASNVNQVSLLRVSNLGGEEAEVTVSGVDDDGRTPGADVRARVPAGASLLLSAEDLESGAAGLTGGLGDGRGKWRLVVRSEGEVSVMSLLASPEGHLTNLSTAAPAALEADGVHTVPLFPSASDELGRQGFARIVNRSGVDGTVRIIAHDDTGLAYDTLSLALGAGKTAHFNSDDLELGNPAKGLSGSTGPGTGDWRLELSSELDIEVLAYVRTPGGFLTSMHDVVEGAGRRYGVAIFNPGSNADQASRLRVVNPGTRPAHVSVGGIDDDANTPGDVVQFTVPAGGATAVTALQLEAGDAAFHDRGRTGIGDGRGKWRLRVDSEQRVYLVNVLASPTGHLTNLSTNPNR